MEHGNESLWNKNVAPPPKETSMQRHGNTDWNRKVCDFQVVKERSINHGSFTYTGNKSIQSVRTSCSCIAQITIEDGRRISFAWTADQIPPHKEEMSVTKLLFVTFADKTEDAVEVKAKIIR